ncbi:MAG: hypothetical protein WCJ11_12225 [Methylococcaceae bacterium]
MRKEKALIDLFRRLTDVLVEEADRNPEFAAKIENLLSDLPEHNRKTSLRKSIVAPTNLPDIHAEWNHRDEIDFCHWLSEQPVVVLRSIIRIQDFDPARRTAKWKDAEKLASFIADGLRARLSRGSAFSGIDN